MFSDISDFTLRDAGQIIGSVFALTALALMGGIALAEFILWRLGQ